MEAGGPMLGVWWVLGCGEPGPVRSEPVPPTVTFEEEGKTEEIIWTDLAEVFPQRPAALPARLQALAPGMEGSAARDVLMAAHQPGVKVFAQPVGDSLAVASILADTTNVGVTLLMDAEGKQLQAVDISIPDDVAVPMLTTRWGDPTSTTFQDGGLARYRWEPPGEPWTAELYPDPDKKKAIIKFSPAKQR
jgi:hypothetical protein